MNTFGFTVSSSTRTGIIITFVLYTLMVVALGIYVKLVSKNENSNQKVADYLTGGGKIGGLALGMLMFTNLMSSGGMIGAPGLSYGVGFIWAITVYSSFVCTLITLASVGKKLAIVGHRIGAQSVIQLFRHRYDSKALSIIISIIFLTFLLPYSASQFAGGAKLFAVITGSNSYILGVLLFAVVTLMYTLAGGLKSLTRIAIFQGSIMLVSVIALSIGTHLSVIEKYGSLQAAMEFVARSRPALVNANTWPIATFIGIAMLMSFAIPALPNVLVTTLTYKKSNVMFKGAIIGVVCYTIVQFTMSGIGPLGYALNQSLTSGDYVIPMLVSSVLPSWLSGLVIAGATAAIQSTVAAFLIIIAGSIMNDFYKGIINPKADDVVINKGNLIFTSIAAVIAVFIALFPNRYIQLIVNFSIGGIASGLIFPLYLGMYWKKATPAAAIVGCVSGVASFMAATLLKSNPAWVIATHGLYPLVFGVSTSLILMIIVSKFSPKVKEGVFQVWFCKTYDEKYAKIG